MSLRNSGILTSNSQSQLEILYLKETLTNAGLILSFNDEYHVLTQEQSLFVRDLEKHFEDINESELRKFISQLKSLCSKQKHFRKALVHTVLRKTGNDICNIEIQQDSLYRLLLRVNSIQKEIIEIVLDEITTVASEETEDTSWLRLLLSSLRYLPYIKDATDLTTKLLDILEVSTFASQLEILDFIPEILPDSQYDQIAKELTKLLDDNDELSGAIIDCLNALNLDSNIRMQVQDRILSKLQAGASLKIFPILLEFLMTDNKTQNIVPILLKIRNSLDTIMSSTGKTKEKDSNVILIFNKLQTFATAPKVVSESWINMILQIKVHSDHKPIDCLILIMLHSTVKSKRKIIEGLFRKRVQQGLFKVVLIEKLFEKYFLQQLLKDYFNSIVEIGCSMLRTNTTIEPTVKDFVSTLFRALFDHPHTEMIYRQELLDNLLVLTGACNQKTVNVVLKIFSYFLQDNPTKLRRHVVLLMRLLEKLDTFELKETKEVFDILCALTCSEQADESLSGLKDEIHMIIRKQLSSSKKVIKHRGIISAVVMAKHTAVTIEDESSEMNISEDSLVNIANLPAGRPREAGCLLELTSTSTAGCPELLGLYYDQLTSMLMTTNNLNKYFMTWLYETITNDFQNIYVAEIVCDNINDLEFEMQYLLNTTDETDTPIGVNIAELTVKSSANNKIVLLAPHFRLLRLLHFRQNHGDLSTIDALLGCGVILPKSDLIDDLDTDQVKQVADCLFHCSNWFREIISAFVTQKSKKLRSRVVQRLNDLIEVEKLLNSCMVNIPEHKLPVSYFDDSTQMIKQTTSPTKEIRKPPKKKLKTSSIVNDLNESESTSKLKSRPNPNKKMTTQELQIHFREMDTDLVILLKYPLKFDDDDEEMAMTQTAFLNLEQIKFIMKDFVCKLSALTKERSIGLSHLNVVVPSNLIKDCVLILPNVDKHFKRIIQKINKLLELTDSRHDLPEMFTEVATDLKCCFGLVLQSFHLIFSWSGFQHSHNMDLLRNILRSLRPEHSQSLNSANRLILEFINRLSDYSDQCLHLSHAVDLVQTMEALYATTVPSPDIKKKIVATSAKLLNKRWYNYRGSLDSGKNCNSNIAVLVNVYLNGASVKTLYGLVGTLQEQAPLLKSKEDCLHMLVAIDKQNFNIFYQGLCTALQNRIKIEIQSLTNNEHLILWRTTALTMQGLMTVAKLQETKTNLGCYLKKSIGILKIFLSHGIPILEIMLRSKPDDVVAIFKTMQTNTRFLHHLCCYSKLMKDSSLMAFVPQFRLTLETLVYRVKAALVANNCSAAFWMGNLRNRDLQGEDILSQSTVVTESNDGDENEEAGNDEEFPLDDSDNEILNNSTTDDNRSESEVFD